MVLHYSLMKTGACLEQVLVLIPAEEIISNCCIYNTSTFGILLTMLLMVVQQMGVALVGKSINQCKSKDFNILENQLVEGAFTSRTYIEIT